MQNDVFYPVSYEDGNCKFRGFKLKEATKFAKLSKVMRNPIKKEDVQFKTLVDIFEPIFQLPDGKSVKDLDLMAFRELAIMSSSYSAKDHATYFSFGCDFEEMENPERDTKQLIYNNLSKDPDVSEDELKQLKEEIDSLPEVVPCNHTIRGSVSFDKLGSNIPNLFQRFIKDEASGYNVNYYTVNHKLLLDKIEIEHNGHIVMMSSLGVTEDIETIDLSNLKSDYKIVFDILKIALHLIDSSSLSEEAIFEKYNELIDCNSSVFQSITEKVKTIIEEKPTLISIECPNCGTEYKIRFDVEDFKLVPD